MNQPSSNETQQDGFFVGSTSRRPRLRWRDDMRFTNILVLSVGPSSPCSRRQVSPLSFHPQIFMEKSWFRRFHVCFEEYTSILVLSSQYPFIVYFAGVSLTTAPATGVVCKLGNSCENLCGKCVLVWKMAIMWLYVKTATSHLRIVIWILMNLVLVGSLSGTRVQPI